MWPHMRCYKIKNESDVAINENIQWRESPMISNGLLFLSNWSKKTWKIINLTLVQDLGHIRDNLLILKLHQWVLGLLEVLHLLHHFLHLDFGGLVERVGYATAQESYTKGGH